MDEVCAPLPFPEGQSAIEAHGIIGDMRSAALIADTGSVDFFCWPDFDSPSLFSALLDTPAAGIFQLAPDLPNARRLQVYLPDTNILQTRWIDQDAVVEVTDLMPIAANADDLPRLIRQVVVINGSVDLHMCCRPRHDYNRAPTQARLDAADVCFEAPGQTGVRLSSTQPLTIENDCAVARFHLREGEHAEFILGGSDDPLVQAGEGLTCHQETVAYWRKWLAQSHYRGRWREAVDRSALALKLLTSRRHGGIVAAATFGLPETLGGERNWDYRYTWIRDASFTVYAFMRLGFVDEANDFMRWVRDRVGDCCEEHSKLRIVYGLDGREHLDEANLDHLSGFKGSQPVRIGNGAYEPINTARPSPTRAGST
jgi:GH15 family glucan-1,4-alpha-glucosidase